MEYFAREDLEELLQARTPPAVSIYLPTERTSGKAEADRLRFRAALSRARELMEDGYGGEGRELLEGLEPLARESEFWQRHADPVAVFVSPELSRGYRVPTEVPELVVVGPSFQTRPLMEHLQAPDRYWVLGLSRRELRLWEGTARGLVPLDFAGLPRKLREVVGLRLEEEEWDPGEEQKREPGLRRHVTGAGSGGGRSPAPVYTGHGTGEENTETEVKRFFRIVDRGLQDLLKDEIGPLVLAAVEEYHPLYRSVSSLDNLTEEGIRASVLDWDPERLHREAWTIAKRSALARVEEALELWETAFGRGKAEQDVANLSRLAVAGRIRLLLTEKDRRVWGHMDREIGTVEILGEGGEDPGGQSVDLLDELAEIVMLRGGRPLILSPDRMPTDTGAAGVLW